MDSSLQGFRTSLYLLLAGTASLVFAIGGTGCYPGSPALDRDTRNQPASPAVSTAAPAVDSTAGQKRAGPEAAIPAAAPSVADTTAPPHLLSGFLLGLGSPTAALPMSFAPEPPGDTTVTAPPGTVAPGFPPLFPPGDTARMRADSARADSARRDTTRRDTTRRDTTGLGIPGHRQLVITDTTYVVDLDSTERLRNFTYVRRDAPEVELFPDRTYPLFAANRTPGYLRQVVVDSVRDSVTVRETFDGVEVKVPVQVPLPDYINLRLKDGWRNMLAAEARKLSALIVKNDIGEMLSNFTKISIPVPANPLFSIFGKNEINLSVSGAVDIKAGFRTTKTDQTTLSILDQTTSEPDFSQEVQVNVNGTIGDKLNILADWNTQRTFEYENQLKIKYTGYDDEIVQSVEAGNVSLSTPSAFIGSSQALFGIKARFQMGPLMLTTLASQKKGQIKEVSVTGGASEQDFEIRPYEYATNHYFVDTMYIGDYERYYQSEPPVFDGSKQILEAEVWVEQQTATTDPNVRQAVALLDLPPIKSDKYATITADSSQQIPGQVEAGRFLRLDQSQYELDGNGTVGVLSLNTSVPDQSIIAIAYRTVDGRQWGEFVRDTSSSGKLILKMVKPRNLLASGPAYPKAWNLLLKNVYAIPGVGRNLKQTGFSLDIFRTNPGGQDQNSILNAPLLRVLGLDNYLPDGNPSPTGDGQFDFRPARTVNQLRAEIIFPYRRPFDEAIVKYFQKNPPATPLDSTYLFGSVYDTTETFSQQSVNNRYVIRGKATGDVSSRFSLGFNVVEGSVQVLLNGAALTPNVDYTVDYIVGEVVIKNAAALVPGANLQIKFEQNDLFQLASKTLLGARGDLAITPTTTLGFTIMNLNQQTLSDKVRLGEEPSNNTILGVDGSTSFQLPFLTRALDALPLIQTHEQSSLKLSGEAAYMLPNANTKLSTIASDNSQGVAYIDDFEGARRTTPVGISYQMWTQASPPADDTSNIVFGRADTSKMNSKAKLIWFNLLPSDVLVTDIYPKKQVATANNQATVLDLRYFPLTRGQFNYAHPSTLAQSLNRTKNWGGVMKTLSVSAINLLKENINSIEIWMKVLKAPTDGTAKMVIDLGSVSERADPSGVDALDSVNTTLPNSEAYVFSKTNPSATVLDGADLGLDMMGDPEEKARWPDLGDDPSGDDYIQFPQRSSWVGVPFEQVTSDFRGINGTQNNLNSPTGRIPDTEDLNNNGQCDQVNSYFEYELSLEADPSRNPRIVGGGNEGWYQYRIPIREIARKVGNPTQENIEYIRVMFVSASDTVAVRIADFNLVGSQWQKVQGATDDSTFALSVVSLETNDTYTSPPGVQRERDLTQPTQNILANEQSLVMELKGVPRGQSRQAVKFYNYRPLDVFNYRTMKMFVHTDQSFRYSDTAHYDAEVFFRFGADSLNFYEYRAPLRPDPGNGNWSDVVIQFSDLTAIKLRRARLDTLSPPKPVPGGPPGATYRVQGTPSLTSVVYLSLGVTNSAKSSADSLVGEVWFDELRLISVDNTKGLAYRFDTQLKLADLAAVSFNYSKVDPNFHTLDQRFGSRQTGINWALGASMSLDKLFPEEWAGTTIPISYSHAFSFVTPKYLPGSDILISEASAQAYEDSIAAGRSQAVASAAANTILYQSETRRVSDTYAAPSFRINFPSRAWYIRDTFNKLTFGFSYTKSSERNPTVARSTAWSWNARLNYSLAFNPDYFVSPFRTLFDGVWFLDEYKSWKLFYSPSSFSWSFSTTRSRSNTLQRAVGAQEIISRNFSASRQFGIGWKLSEGGLLNPFGDYSLSVESSLLDLELDQFQRQRSFSRILSDIFFSDRFINFGKDTRYSQHNAFNTKPAIPNIFNIKKFLDVGFSYTVDYAWSNSLTSGDLGKSVGFNNTINVTSTLRLKSLFDPLFESAPQAPESAPTIDRGRRGRESRTEPEKADTLQRTDTTRAKGGGGKGTLAQLKMLAKLFLKTPFLDYDNVSITFNQTNNAQNSGIPGGPGFINFWGRVPFLQESDPEDGPSRLYQLGLISDPTGRLTNFRFQAKFPFFAWDVEPGPRAKAFNVNIMNTYRENNRLSFKTSRALWEGARIDLNWNVGWSYNRSQTLVTDSVTGIPSLGPLSTSGSVDRSFLTLPDFLFLGMFKTSLKDVSKRYADLNGQQPGLSDDAKQRNLNQAFEEGFEALPILRKIFGPYFPRVNWSFRWDGLEKLPLFEKWVSRLSLDHSYTSNYTRQFENLQGGGGERTNAQRVAYGFTPLVGANFTFKELGKGSIGANLRYSTSTTYDLSAASQNLVETLSQEFSLTASYSRKGFEIPLFGLSLNNDIDISLSYSVRKNSQKTYDVSQLDINVTGTPLEGSTTTVIEPTIKYVLSQRVQASIYYRYTNRAPDIAGSRIPGSTMNEAGLNIHISIQ